MKINDVVIHNWTSPEWWDDVAARPHEPLIEATIRMTLSNAEYQELLARDTPTPIQTSEEVDAMLDRFAAKGREAWKNVPNATAWVEELRGQTEPTEHAKIPD